MWKLQSRGQCRQLQRGRRRARGERRRARGDAALVPPSPRAAVQQGGCNTSRLGYLPPARRTGEGCFTSQGPGVTWGPAQHQPVLCSRKPILVNRADYKLEKNQRCFSQLSHTLGQLAKVTSSCPLVRRTCCLAFL